jgi:1,2-diacylglycerol 3-alpha-glucosyltransferase
MKIAIYSDTYPPQINGVSIFAELSSRALTKRGHEVKVFSPASLPSMPFWGYPGERMVIPLGFSLLNVHKFMPDIIHTHTPFGVGWEAIYAATILGVPVVGTHHTFYDHYLKHVHLENELSKKMSWIYTVTYYNRCDAVTTPSKSLGKTLADNGLKRPMYVVPNCIDTDLFVPSEKKKKGNRFIYMGRLGYEKSIDVAINAFAILKKDLDAARFSIVGDGPERKDLEDLVSRLGLGDSVTFCGVKRGADLAEALREADIFLTASASENMPLSVLEAMASGLPVVGARSLGIPEIVRDGGNGLLFEPGNASDMAEKMRTLLGDAGMKEKFSEASRAFAMDFSMDRIGEMLEEVYEKIRKEKNENLSLS